MVALLISTNGDTLMGGILAKKCNLYHCAIRIIALFYALCRFAPELRVGKIL